MSYATVDQFETMFRNRFLSEWLGDIPNRQAVIAEWIEAASAKIDGALQAAGYPSPVEAADVAADFQGSTLRLLAFHAVALAGAYMLAGVKDVPPGPKQVISASEKWLADLQAGAVKVPGLSRLASEVAARAAGGVRFVAQVGEHDDFPDGFHSGLRMV